MNTLTSTPMPVFEDDLIKSSDIQIIEVDGERIYKFVAHFLVWLRRRAAFTNKPYIFNFASTRLHGTMLTAAGTHKNILEIDFMQRFPSWRARGSGDSYYEIRLRTLNLGAGETHSWLSGAGKFKRISSAKKVLDEHLFSKELASTKLMSLYEPVAEAASNVRRNVEVVHTTSSNWFAHRGQLFGKMLLDDSGLDSSTREECIRHFKIISDTEAHLVKTDLVVLFEYENAMYAFSGNRSDIYRVIAPLPESVAEAVAILRLHDKHTSGMEGIGAQVRGNGITAFAVYVDKETKEEMHGKLDSTTID